MVRWKGYLLIVLLGIGIGLVVPYVTYNLLQPASIQEVQAQTPASELQTSAMAKAELKRYHFAIKDDILSVVEGGIGADGQVVFAGYEVKEWDPGLRALAEALEFGSLDEVQSFIDTVSEPEWILSSELNPTASLPGQFE